MFQTVPGRKKPTSSRGCNCSPILRPNSNQKGGPGRNGGVRRWGGKDPIDAAPSQKQKKGRLVETNIALTSERGQIVCTLFAEACLQKRAFGKASAVDRIRGKLIKPVDAIRSEYISDEGG